jgi:hypothetical protein
MVPRQEAWIMIHTAKALALTGRADEAIRLVREGVALESGRDTFDAAMQHADVAEVFLILNRREDALAELREMTAGVGMLMTGPVGIRFDPLWSRLKGDPRFEEILKSAKPL